MDDEEAGMKGGLFVSSYLLKCLHKYEG